MLLSTAPMRLSLHAVSMHLLWAKTNWQNVQDEAAAGRETARQMVQTFRKEHTVPADTLKAYLADVATSGQV